MAGSIQLICERGNYQYHLYIIVGVTISGVHTLNNRNKSVGVSVIATYFLVVVLILFGDEIGFTDLFEDEPTLNREIMKSVKSTTNRNDYIAASRAESYDNYGVTRDIRYLESVVAEKSPNKKIYCVGLMFDIYMKSCEIAKGKDFVLPKVSLTNFSEFRKDFYGVDGNKKTFVHALESRGLGREIRDLNEARKGDLVQFWRKNSGHAVVFLEWHKKDEEITGIRYWSVQSRTGIGVNSEKIGEDQAIKPDQVYIVRAFEPK